MLALYIILSVVLMSLIEYVAHRWFMHNKHIGKIAKFLYPIFEKHTLLHHRRFYRVFDSELDPAAKYINIKFDTASHIAGALPFAALFWWLVCPELAITFVTVVAIHAQLWNHLHSEMHNPEGTWFSKLSVYKFLRDYHKCHHDHPNKNYNVVIPLMDFVFGTYRKADNG